MTAEQWNTIYRREKEKGGAKDAAATLMRGCLREIEYRKDFKRGNDLWNAVARNNPELLPDAVRGYVTEKMPECSVMFGIVA